MASLSNINGLFDVHSTGAILFSNTHGTSGQILKSNGNAAPTWVDASTVIGGPYLPLTGGTLTGPLSGTSATFSGNIQLGGTTPTLNFYKTSNADILANIKVETDAGSGGKLTIQTKRNGNTAIDALVIDDNQKVGIGTDSPLTKLDIRNGELTVRPSWSFK
jgi:hypothetical protein